MSNETKWAYLAGIVDGEGCISYMKNKGRPNQTPRQVVRLTIVQSDKNIVLLDWCAEFLEECGIRYSWFEGTYKGHGRNLITVAAQESLHECLTQMIPYLTLKQDRAIEAVRFLNVQMKRRQGKKVKGGKR